MAIGGVRAVNARLPELLLGRLAGLPVAGLYNRAAASLEMVTRNGVEPIARVMLPILVQEHERGESLAGPVIRLAGNLTAVFWPILAVLALKADTVIEVLFGRQWGSAAPALSMLCLWVALLLPTSGAGETLLIMNRLRTSFKIEVLRLILGCTLIGLAAPHGLLAVAAARVLEPLILIPVFLYVLKRCIGLSVTDWLRSHAASAVLTVITIAPLLLLDRLSPAIEYAVLELVLVGAASAASWIVALLITKHTLAAEVISIVRRPLAGWRSGT
jgi:O-antigen/teichoic acid export membrane protein